MHWRLIETGPKNGAMNMAIDEALIISEEPVLRLYRWKPPCLSIGYFQAISQINTKECKRNGIDIVRRPTGGNAVLHDNELTYCVVINEKYMPDSIIESYKTISKGLLEALKMIGLKAKMNRDIKKQEKSAICFNDPSWYEIIVNNKKIIGSAQKRMNGKILQHGAILIDIDIKKYCCLFSGFNKKLIERVKNRMTSINNELNKKISYRDIKNATIKGFKKALDIKFKRSRLTKKEKLLAEKLYKKKYSKRNWNFMR